MTSSVFFKFKSQKDPTRVEFDGTGISVFELKRDIIIKSGLGDGKDFDLAIYNEDGSEEYDDDTTIIPRSTSVIARRLPPMKQGAGRAARYVNGKMPINTKNSSRKEQSSTKSAAKPPNPLANTSNMTEEQRMAAMFAAQSEQWSAQQEEMAHQPRVPFKGGKNTNAPDHEPPSGYVCYRCGEKGHWIQACPTNDNPEFDNKPRVKRTTGIPRSFLKTVEKPVALSGDGTTDDTRPPPGIMVNAEGEYVIAEPDKASWAQFQAKSKSSAAAQEAAALGDKELRDIGLECSIDKRIFIDPMKTPCCEKTYCNDCITNALIESDFQCPGCQTEGVLIDDLKPDEETSAKIKTYLAEKNAAAKKERSKSPSVKAKTPPVEAQVKTKSPSPKSPPKDIKSQSPTTTVAVAKAKSPNPEIAPAKDQPASRKRPADELLENPKIPKGPKAMQQQQEAQQQAMLKQQQQQQQQNMMNGMSGFPNMGAFNPMMGMNGFGGMPNMNMNTMNMNMMNGYGMGTGMGLGMGMGNPMMGMGIGMGMPMMGMNGFGSGGSMHGMSSNNMYGGGGAGGFGGMGNMRMANNHLGAAGQQSAGGQAGAAAAVNGLGVGVGFSNQQKTVFAEPLPNEEDNAYFRQPVNPHRHQGRQRRARPSDYREL